MIRFTDEEFYVRDAVLSDIPLYAQMLRSEEWMLNSGFNIDEFREDDQIRNFLAKEHPDDIRWLVFHDEKGFLGFINFKIISDEYAITIGGIVTKYLNSGIGIKLIIECINLYFTLGYKRKLRHNILQENLRSCKMHWGIGDKLVGLKFFGNHKYDVYETDKNLFYTSLLAKRFLNNNHN